MHNICIVNPLRVAAKRKINPVVGFSARMSVQQKSADIVRVKSFAAVYVQKTVANECVKVVVLHRNSYRFASESVSVCGVNG